MVIHHVVIGVYIMHKKSIKRSQWVRFSRGSTANMAGTREWFENFLENDQKDRRIVKVVNMTEERAANDGENFTSEIKRITLNAVLGSGGLTEIKFIVKRMPNSEEMRTFHEENHHFTTEIAAFKDVLSQMSRLMADEGDFREPLWCDVKAITEEALVFEDLCDKGYAKVSGSVTLNEDQCVVVIKSLARFHAMGLALVHRKLVNREALGSYVIYKGKISNSFLKPALEILRKSIDESWGPEWKEELNALSRLIQNYDRIIQEFKAIAAQSLLTIIHGDPWAENLMFKTDLDGQVLSVKFLDYQVLAYDSFAFDLIVVLNCCLSDDLRREKYDDLLRLYHKYFVLNADFFKLDASLVPSLSEISRILEDFQVMTFIIKCLYFPFLQKREIVSLTDAYDDSAEQKSVFAPGIFKSEEAKRDLGGKLRGLVDKGLV